MNNILAALTIPTGPAPDLRGRIEKALEEMKSWDAYERGHVAVETVEAILRGDEAK